MGLMVGKSFTALTVSAKLRLAVPAPFDATSVMRFVPLRSRAGVMVTLRFVPAPLNTMFVTGTSVVLEELPDRMTA